MNNLSPQTTHVDPKIIARWQRLPLVGRLRDWSSTLSKPLSLPEAHAQELMHEAARELEWYRSRHQPKRGYFRAFYFGLGWGAAFIAAFLVLVLSNPGRLL